MNSPAAKSLRARRLISSALFFIAFGIVGFALTKTSSSQASRSGRLGQETAKKQQQKTQAEPADLRTFRESVGGSIKAMIVELRDQPGVLRKVAQEKAGQTVSLEETISYAQDLMSKQDAFLASLEGRGVRALLRKTDVQQIDGSTRHIQYRFTYLLHGFVAYIAAADVEKLRALPEVAHVSEPEEARFHLDRSIDHTLGTQPDPAERRTAVYGATKEFSPDPSDPTHPETPRSTTIDGFEGQNINIAVIDSGVDYRHPMFGGTGLDTPLPRVSGTAEDPADNKKVIYFYAFNQPAGNPTDDFGHGTLVASNAAGYAVDGNTPPRAGFGTGRDGTGIGPTTNGSQLFGTAPQARIMAYKVCGPAPNCAGDIELSMEDAASPVTLVGQGDGGSIPTMVPKPVADVINLSLGSESGDAAGPTSRQANNAALAGTIVVASAGNSGPGAGTIGAPAAGTLVLSVAASLDPGSVAGGDVLATNQIPLEPCAVATRTPNCDSGTQVAGPLAEEGASSNANAPEAGAPQGIKVFPVAGGGALPVEENPGEPTENTGSVSAHYVFVDRTGTPPAPVPASVTNRIAVVKGSGTFASIANPVAVQNPAAILIVTATESATAVAVVGGIPTFTIGLAAGEDLLDRLSETDDNSVDPANGAVSRLPIRLADTISLAAFQGTMAGFSSRGPNDHPNARFRVIKPDVTAPGVGIFGAATPTGLPDDTVGLASVTGYTTANGTSFSGPITAGAIALVRQRVRQNLNLDTTNLMDAQYRAKRFDTVTVSRALLQNTATNLRTGLGQAEPDGSGSSSDASINDLGSGHINIAGALSANAVMISPTALLTEPAEFTADDPIMVQLPTASFGEVPVVGVNGTVVRAREVIIRDVTNGAGGGTYNLTSQNNRPAAGNPGFVISFTASAESTTPITSVSVPAGGQTSFFVRVDADGTQITTAPTEFQWFVTATPATGQRLRMPFYYRAINATIPNITAPEQQELEGVEQPPAMAGSCPIDTNGSYTVRWAYSLPGGGSLPVGFRVQEATRSDEVFFDPADEPLVGGANSMWTGSAQWNTQTNPESGSLAYFVPDAAMQDEALTMVNSVNLPPGGATLSFLTNQDTEQDFDFANVEVSTDGVNFATVATFSGTFVGTRFIDISPYAGQSVKIRFRLTSDLAVPAPGWYVEDIRISSDDFATVADTAAGATSLLVTGRPVGTYTYRIAGVFQNPATAGTTIVGPYSNLRCVAVQSAFQNAVSRKTHADAGSFSIDLGSASGIENRNSGNNDHEVVFTFATPITPSAVTVTPGPGGTATLAGSSTSGNQVIVNLSNVSNAQTLSISLAGTPAIGVPMRILMSDVNASRRVDAGDLLLVRQRNLQPVAEANFRTDVNASGRIDSGDVLLTRRQNLTELPD